MIYEYGAMSSKFSIEADNKLTAYAGMIIHFNTAPQLVAIYSPEDCSATDSWLMRTGDELQERLDWIFGGEKGSFVKYLEEHPDEIRKACESIIRLI